MRLILMYEMRTSNQELRSIFESSQKKRFEKEDGCMCDSVDDQIRLYVSHRPCEAIFGALKQLGEDQVRRDERVI